MTKESRFSYSCNRCSRCCSHKIIRVNPFEVARLAANKGVSTSVFLKKYTTGGGTVLRATPEGKCVFLSADGCAVHPDRPFVCRLYPLQRHVHRNGTETFSLAEPHEGCRASRGIDGPLSEYLDEQVTEEFREAVDEYLRLTGLILAALEEEMRQTPALAQEVRSIGKAASADPEFVGEWIDMDLAVSSHCQSVGKAIPEDPREKMKIHIGIMQTQLKKLHDEGSSDEEKEAQ